MYNTQIEVWKCRNYWNSTFHQSVYHRPPSKTQHLSPIFRTEGHRVHLSTEYPPPREPSYTCASKIRWQLQKFQSLPIYWMYLQVPSPQIIRYQMPYSTWKFISYFFLSSYQKEGTLLLPTYTHNPLMNFPKLLASIPFLISSKKLYTA